MQIGVVAKFRIKKEYVIELYPELQTLHKLTHELDEGCIQYDLHQDIEDEQTFIFVETWRSAEDLKAHEQKEHFNHFICLTEGKMESVEVNKTIQKL